MEVRQPKLVCRVRQCACERPATPSVLYARASGLGTYFHVPGASCPWTQTCRPARSAPVDVLPLEWGNAAHLRAVQAWHVAAAAGRLRGGGAGHLPQGEQPGRQGPPEDVVESSYPAACQGNKPGTCGADGVGAEVCGRKTAATAADGERGGNRSGSAGGGGGGRLGLLVLGSDLVYSAASRPALVATVADLLRGAAVAARGTGGAAGGPGVGAACVARGAAPEPLALLSFEDRPGVEELPGLWRRHGLEATEVGAGDAGKR